ncbi:DcrB-related protein [Erwiniaceae bacterium CAU 1747]
MYQINEGTFVAPEGWRDESINVFICPDNSGINLTITRAAISMGIPPEETYQDTLKEFSANLPGYKEIGRHALMLGNAPAYQLEYQWKSPEGMMHQLVVMLVMEDLLVSFTFTSPGLLSHSQKAALLPTILNFRARNSREA